MDPYFTPQGQRPTYYANRETIIEALHEFSKHAGITVIETDNLQSDELRATIAKRLRAILKLIDQADGKA
jgi:hypothetical protein